jgi:exodeoxyribonuclease VII small subunit
MEETADLTFEQAFRQLEEVVQKLEAGDLPLEESLALFERGMLMARLCEGKLEQAEQKVSQIVSMDSEGPVLAPFVAEEE